MPMTAQEARAWMARWQEVDRVSLAEAQRLTPEAKLRQLDSLMQAAGLFEWPPIMDREDERVRELWMRLHALNGI
jgi:hypothetical protein